MNAGARPFAFLADSISYQPTRRQISANSPTNGKILAHCHSWLIGLIGRAVLILRTLFVFFRRPRFGPTAAPVIAENLMDSISISAASGMRTRMESLELLANNLANTSDPNTGDTNTQPVIESHWTDLAQGELRNTTNQLDFAINGDGLFGVQTARGVRYTRNGNFKVLPSGALATGDGSTVRAVGGGQILLQPDLPVDVLPDGTVRQGLQTVGQMEIVSFDRSSINKEGTSYFAPFAGAKSKPATGTVLQGKLEQSNVGAAESAVRLVAIMRQFEMLQKAASIGNDLNKEAITEVARVVS
jgi:flagellar basal body rod protein FlgG